MSILPTYTWDQATILGLMSADAGPALDIAPATIRKWASRGHITAAGVGPNGRKLYQIADVCAHAERPEKTRGRKPTGTACLQRCNSSHLDADGSPMPSTAQELLR